MFEKEYSEYLMKKMHREPNGDLYRNRTEIHLDFKLAHLGEVNTYRVVRSWSLNNTKIKEHLQIYRNTMLIDDIEAKYWQDFLREIVPLEFTKLFFYCIWFDHCFTHNFLFLFYIIRRIYTLFLR